MLKKINAAALIDVDSQNVLRDVTVIIEDNTISWVGRSIDCPADLPVDVEYDLAGKVILPGLINAHLHLAIRPNTYDEKDFFESFSQDAPELLAIYATQNAETELLSGVTTVRDCGAPGSIVEHLRNATRNTNFYSPRLFHCGPIVTATGGHGHTMGAEADGPAALQKLIRNLAQNGVDFIKIAATGGGTPGTKPHLSYFDESELKAVVTTAHSLELKVAAHVRGIEGIKDTIAAGVDSLEHCDFEYPEGRLTVLPEELDLMAEKSIYLVPTIRLYKDLINRGIKDTEPQEYITTLQKALEQKCKALEVAVKAGVQIAAGNDAGLPDTTFGELWKELQIMSQSGMANMRVLQSATCDAARLLSCNDITGSIRVGMSADIIAVKENPVDNIETLRDVCFVMKEGAVYKNNNKDEFY